MDQRLHLITTCTLRKAGSVADRVFPSAAATPDAALMAWHRLINQAMSDPSNVRATGELYRGASWQRARSIASRRDGIELWAMSAGLGLRHHSDPAVTYEATFHTMPFEPGEIWALLTERPPLPGRCNSLARLMQSCPDDRFVIAGSPVYVSAAERDILAGIPALRDPGQLTIITSKGYRGPLAPWVKRSSAAMMTALKSNMTCLNIACAGQLIEGLMKRAPQAQEA